LRWIARLRNVISRKSIVSSCPNPLLVFGQTALFFYVLHFLVLGGSAIILAGGMNLGGLEETYLAAIATLFVLYPVCIGFRRLKRKYPNSLLQYI
jgi:hypothetical protein